MFNLKSLSEITPIIIALFGTIITLTAIVTKTGSPEVYNIASMAFSGAAGLARSPKS